MRFIHIIQYGAIFNKLTFANINLLNKALLIVVIVFVKVKIRKAFRCNIVSSEDLLKLNHLCHLITEFSNFSQFYLSLVIFFCIHIKHVFAFLYNTASFILVTAIVFCQPNFLGDCANGFANVFSVHNDFNTISDFIRLLNFTYSFVKVNVDVSYDGNRNLSELMRKSKPGSNGSSKNAILIFLFLTSSFFHLLIKQKPDVRVKIIPLVIFSLLEVLQNIFNVPHLISRSHFLPLN